VTALDVPSGLPAALPTPAAGDPRLARLSLNQRTTDRWSLRDAIEGCLRAGIPAIGLWREPVAQVGLRTACRIVAASGLRVSSLCRGGFLTEPGAEASARAIDDNRRAIDEAAALGAASLVMVVGGLPPGSRDLPGARQRVAERIAELAPYAQKADVQLALEPMNPLYCADRGVLSTLRQSLDLAESFSPEQVGVTVDTFHVWWDPDLAAMINRAGSRIGACQVCDWITPLPADSLLARGMPGDGHIDFQMFMTLVDKAGYVGDVEVEIFNAQVWAADPDEVLATIVRRYVSHVLPG
jgi:sugar phosphate isomerase/epimerase